ncbi:MAG: 50S ribosomal protein L15 [Spirochaetia bacterium]
MSDFMIHPPKGSKKKKKIIGRGVGSGKGSTAGRGTKGQKARSGGNVRPGFEGGQMPLYRRIARRGFSNHNFKTTYEVVNVRDIDSHFEDGAEITIEALINSGLAKKGSTLVKLLGEGDTKKKFTVKVSKVSASAKEKIEKAGGNIEEMKKQVESNG